MPAVIEEHQFLTADREDEQTRVGTNKDTGQGRVNGEPEKLLAMQRSLKNIPSRENRRCKGPGVSVWS